ncbi:MAG TPA: protein-glutamate O-methyltransferase CheR [Candidatus Thermoplasmatota archaeon]|nr:protein-glutamate O-methyltransferase CheR [Candidatus Thermoplasmatota archaeon]
MGQEQARGVGSEAGLEVSRLLGEAGYQRLRRVLRSQEGYDLDAYRGTYLARRLRARLSALHMDPRAYASFVERDNGERRLLIETLGVNVSSFFRDPAVWSFLLDDALPPLLEARAASGDLFRAASLGCAGGQEPYSLAMTLNEAAQGLDVDWQVEGFDMDPGALEMAEEALYPAAALAEVSRAALDRYFTQLDEECFEVIPSLRARVRFRKHDILTEPLPARYDLIACRNVMIYVDGPAKERLLDKIHGSLQEDGILVIGQSEVLPPRLAQRFVPLDLRHRIYRNGG